MGKIAIGLAFLALACTEQDAPAPVKPKKVVASSEWQEVKVPVPVGMKVPCATLIDAEKASEALGKYLEVADASSTDREASSVCGLKIAKPDPKSKKPAPKPAKDDGLGLQVGDELCQVSAYCWYHIDVADMKKGCEAKGQSTSSEVGDLTCTLKTQAGEGSRTTLTVLEPDTRCKLIVKAGPNVKDESVVSACAHAAVDLIGPDSIKIQ